MKKLFSLLLLTAFVAPVFAQEDPPTEEVDAAAQDAAESTGIGAGSDPVDESAGTAGATKEEKRAAKKAKRAHKHAKKKAKKAKKKAEAAAGA